MLPGLGWRWKQHTSLLFVASLQLPAPSEIRNQHVLTSAHWGQWSSRQWNQSSPHLCLWHGSCRPTVSTACPCIYTPGEVGQRESCLREPHGYLVCLLLPNDRHNSTSMHFFWTQWSEVERKHYLRQPPLWLSECVLVQSWGDFFHLLLLRSLRLSHSLL